MANGVPDWFLEKYSTPVGEQPSSTQTLLLDPPAPPPKYQTLINLEEPGDTQQERERLPTSRLSSIKKQSDPIILASIADRIGLDLTGVTRDAALPPTTVDEPLSKAPVRPIPSPLPEGKKVFTDQARWEQILDEAPEEASPVTFKKAFKQARAAGEEEFEYKGNRFNTRERGESGMDWAQHLEERQQFTPFVEGFVRERALEEIPEVRREEKAPTRVMLTPKERASTRRTQRVAAYRQSVLQTEPKPTEPSFSDAMKRSGVTVAKGKNVDVSQLSSKLGEALEWVGETLRSAGITPEITSGKRSQGNWSLHEIGEATDLRLKNASPEALKKLKSSLPGTPISVKIHGEKGQLWKQGDHEYIIHGHGSNIHLHVERDSEETKAALAEHLASQGKEGSISRRGLRAYPNLLKQYFPEAQM